MRLLKSCLTYSVLLATATSCRRKTQIPVVVKRPLEEAKPFFDEACLLDISLPWGVNAHDISTPEHPEITAIRYESTATLTALHEFYMIDMERQGWICVQDLSAQKDRLLLFEKPSRCCIMHIAQQAHHTLVIMFVYPKRASDQFLN